MTEPRPADFGIGRLFSNIRDAVIVGNADDGLISLWNPGAEAMFGYLADEMVGKPIELIVPDRLKEQHRAGLARYRASGQGAVIDSSLAVELPALHKSGREITVELMLNRIEQAEPAGNFVLGIVRDVTERKRAEAEQIELAREQAARGAAELALRRLAFLADASKQLASSLDYEVTLASVARLAVPVLADWCVVDLLDDNGQFRRVEVVHSDPARADLAAELKSYPPDSRAQQGIPEVLLTAQPEIVSAVSDDLLRAITRNDRHREVVRQLGFGSTLRVPLVARGRTLGVLSFVAAEPNHYGALDQELAEDLAARCAMAVDNARLYSAAQEAVRQRDEFLAAVSHDLKNPLTAIRGYAQLLQRGAGKSTSVSPELISSGLAKIDATAGRMMVLIRELLDVAQLEMGRPLELDLGPADLVSIVRQLVAEHQAIATGHTLRIETSEHNLAGHWDAARVERVVSNLIDNATKFSPDGGEVAVNLARESDSAGEWAVLEVRDQGVGIPAADLEGIFEPFRRGANVVGRIAGTGLGLSGARQIVEQHGGTLSVASAEGVGTTLTLRLPL